MMQQYQCHKLVRAAKIKSLGTIQNNARDGFLELDGHPGAYVSQEWMEKHKPVVGGYFVQYEDGYQSFSPAKAFEEGYSPVAEEF